jgi:hypothetical protein
MKTKFKNFSGNAQILTKEQQKSLKGGGWTLEQCQAKCGQMIACVDAGPISGQYTHCNLLPFSSWGGACGRYFVCEVYV